MALAAVLGTLPSDEPQSVAAEACVKRQKNGAFSLNAIECSIEEN
jgi:hypothetical protein